MMDLTRDEQHELIRLLGIVIDNGHAHRDSLYCDYNDRIRREILHLVQCAERVRYACMTDLKNQEG
jgi:hypothetical protein